MPFTKEFIYKANADYNLQNNQNKFIITVFNT